MTISREEFLRLLAGAVGAVDYRANGAVLSHQDGDRRWEIRLEELPALSRGMLLLPRHRVEIRLVGYDSPEAQVFLDRFERHFQRGGG